MKLIETILIGILFGWSIISIPLPIIAGIIVDYRKTRTTATRATG